MRRRYPRVAVAVLLAALLIRCTDAPTSPVRRSRPFSLVLSARYSSASEEIARSLGDFGFQIERAHVAVTGRSDVLRKDTIVVIPPSASTLSVALAMELGPDQEELNAKVELLHGATILFSGSQSIVARRGEITSSPAPIEVGYSGPGRDATRLAIEPESLDVALNGSTQLTASAFTSSNAAVTDLPIAWSTSDASVATLVSSGNTVSVGATAQATDKPGTATITARGINGVTASAFWRVLVPARLAQPTGGGQVGTVGTSLPQPFGVQVLAADGARVPGVTVRFTALTSGGGVGTATVITNSQGRASTSISLGEAAGSYEFQASLPNYGAVQPVTISATANPGAASRLQATALAPSSQSGALLPMQPSLSVRDAFGNAVPASGVVITAAVASPYSLIGTTSVTTDAQGVAAFTNLGVSGVPGPVTLIFSANGLSPATATTALVAGVPARVVAAPNVPTSGSRPAGSSVPLVQLPAVLVEDGTGNPVPGASVAFSASGGTIGVSGSTPGPTQSTVTDAGGIARLTSWTLPSVTGTATVTASVAGAAGSPVTFTMSVTGGGSVQLNKSGEGQNAIVNTVLPTPVSVVARDQNGNPVPGIVVSFSVGVNSGSVSAGGSFGSTATATTDGSGVASVSWQLGTQAGPNSLTASAIDVSPVTFSATGLAGAATHLALISAPNSPTSSGVAFTTQPAVQRRDQFENPVLVNGASVVATASAGYSLVGGTSATTSSAGTATFTDLGVSGPDGLVTITFSSAEVTAATATVAVGAGAPALMNPYIETTFTAVAGSSVGGGELPAVAIYDAAHNSVPGVAVTFTVSGGTITAPSGSAPPSASLTVLTDDAGVARVTTWTLPPMAGTATVTATLTGVSGSPVTFTATVTPGSGASLSKTAGDNQTGTVNAPVASPPTVVVRDASNNVVPNAPVTFTVSSGGGAVSGGGAFGPSVVATTDAAGAASVNWRLGTTAGANGLTAATPGGQSVTFVATGNAGSAASLSLSAVPTSASSGGVFVPQPAVQLRDQFANPVSTDGLTITAFLSTGYSLVGTPTAATNGSGLAVFADLGASGPAGTVTLTFSSSGLAAATVAVPIGVGKAATLDKSAGDAQSAVVNTTVATQPTVVVRDGANNPVPGTSVTFSVATGGGVVSSSGPFSSTVEATTDANGAARVSWRLGTIAGANTLTAAISGGPSVTFSAIGTPGAAASLAKTSGDGQSATVNTALDTPPTVQVRDAHNNLVPNTSVVFTVSAGGGAVSNGGAFAVTVSATTDGTGTAGVTWRLGTTAGANTLSAVIPGGASVTFSATGTPSAAGSLSKTLGDGQTAVVGSPVATPPTVVVRDANGNVVPGTSVTFSIASGSGAVSSGGSFAPSVVVPTDEGGAASVNWRLGTTAGANTLNAAISGGPSVTFSATGTPGAPAALAKTAGDNQSAVVNTAMAAPPTVVVRDASGNAVPNTSVAFTVATGAGSVSNGGAFGPSTVVTTDAGGAASASWRLGAIAGANSLTVSVSGVPDVTFAASGLPDAAAQLSITTPPNSSVASGAAFTSQPTVQLRDQFGNNVAANGVTVTAAATGYSLVGATAVTSAAGLATFTSLGVSGPAGPAVITFSSPGLAQATAQVTIVAGTVAAMAKTAGDNQTAVVGSPVATSPTVVVRDANSNVVPNTSVAFSITSGGGAVSSGESFAPGVVVMTDAGGAASVAWRLGTTAGANTLNAAIPGGPSVTFSAVGTPGAVAVMTKTEGDNQSATVNTAVATQPAVVVRDEAGNPLQGVAVTFAGTGNGAVSSGGAFAATVNASTDATGTARVDWRLATAAGQNSLTATVAGLQSVTFSATGIAGAATQLTFVTAPNSPSPSGAPFSTQPSLQLRDQFGNAVPSGGVDVNAAVPPAFGTAGATSAATSANGVATFTNLGVSGAVGPVTVSFSAVGLPTATAQVAITVGEVASLSASVSTTLTGSAGQEVSSATLPAVTVRDAAGNPVPGIPVSFAVAGGTIATTNGSAPPNPIAATADASGVARLTSWSLPAVTGSATVTASLSGVTGSPVVFTATVVAAPVSQLALVTNPSSPNASGSVFATQPVVQLRDQSGNAALVGGVGITASVPPTYTLIGEPAATTNAAGTASFTNLGVRGPAGVVTITFNSGSFAPAAAQVELTPGAAASMSKIAGDAQSAPLNATLPTQPAVLLLDQDNNPVSGATVSFSVNAGNGTVSTGGAPSSSATAVTDAAGTARVSWQLGTTPGTDSLRATVTGLPAVVFTATATALPAERLDLAVAPSSPSPSGASFATQPAVQLLDQLGNVVALAGVPVTASVPQGYTLIGNATSATNASGVAVFSDLGVNGPVGPVTIAFTAANTVGVSANVTVSTGAPALMQIIAGDDQQALMGSAVPINPSVRVLDPGGNPVPGVAVSFVVPESGGGGGIVQPASVTTNGSGIATVSSWALGGQSAAQLLNATATGLGTSFHAMSLGQISVGASAGNAGTGIVTGDGFNCAIAATGAATGTCVLRFAWGTAVTLTGTASAGNQFGAWTAAPGCSASPSCVVTLNESAAVAVGVSFMPTTRAIAIHNSASSGAAGVVTSSPDGINCTVSPANVAGNCSQSFSSLTSVTLTAVPGLGAAFSRWEGACSGTTPTCVLAGPTTGDQDVTAVFAVLSYSRNFATMAGESLLSDNSAWGMWGKTTGVDWDDVRVSNGLAHGVFVNSQLRQFSDPTALLGGTWSPDQEAEAVIKGVDAIDAGCNQEVQLRLRSSIAPNSNAGYEIILQMKGSGTTSGGTYFSVTRWNGPHGDFTELLSLTGYDPHDGDRIRARIVGNTISLYYNDVLQDSVTDDTFATGNPGMGFYISPFDVADCFSRPNAFGLSSFSARAVAP